MHQGDQPFAHISLQLVVSRSSLSHVPRIFFSTHAPSRTSISPDFFAPVRSDILSPDVFAPLHTLSPVFIHSSLAPMYRNLDSLHVRESHFLLTLFSIVLRTISAHTPEPCADIRSEGSKKYTVKFLCYTIIYSGVASFALNQKGKKPSEN